MTISKTKKLSITIKVFNTLIQVVLLSNSVERIKLY